MNAIAISFMWFAKVCNLLLIAVFYMTFIAALLSDSNAVLVTVNDYGEGMIEFVLFTVIITLIVAGYAFEWRKK